MLHISIRPSGKRRADKAADRHIIKGVINLYQRICKFATKNSINGGFEVVVAGCGECILSVADESEGNFGMRKGDFINNTCDSVGFADILFEKFHSRRGVEKQISNNYCRTDGTAGILDKLLFSAADGVFRAGFALFTGEEFNPCNRGNRCKCFATEAEGCDAIKVVNLIHLAGCVA